MPVKVLPIILGALTLAIVGGVARVKNQAAEKIGASGTKNPLPTEIPLCSGPAGGGWASAQGKPHPHSVTLSWKAAVPASSSSRDAIQGYYVYRRLASQTYTEANRMSESPLRETRCVDPAVEPRKTYYYAVRTVTDGGTRSAFSAEIKAVIPYP
jgi:hypothetical protein